MKGQTSFRVGDSVIVKPKVKDPDTGGNIGGWQGRISEIGEDNLICIDWDSVTLRNMPGSVIDKCEEKGLGWNQIYLYITDVELVTPRDTEEDVSKMFARLEREHRWSYLGEEGKRIQKILANVDEDDEEAALEAWEKHLRKVLKFPFEAEISEFQERGPLQGGDRVVVQRISGVVDLYGVLVEIRYKRSTYTFPLSDLEATDIKSPNHDFVMEYAVWSANR